MTVEVVRLATLLDVEGRVLAASSRAALAFVTVNETHALAPYRQAAIWSRGKGVEALSGLAVVEANAPFVLWLERLFNALATTRDRPAEITAADLPPALGEQWGTWLPAHALFLPWRGAALLLAREEAWDPTDRMLLERLAEAVAATWRGFDQPSPLAWLRPVGRSGRRLYWIAGALVLAGCFPVTSSVLAPAEMAPAHPAVIRAPTDGVVDKLQVMPNDRVTAGQPLFELDATTLLGKLDVARQEAGTAEAEYRQADQAQLFDPKAKAQVAVLMSKLEEQQAEVKWLATQLDRIRVKAPRGGVAVFDDPSEWVGRPVAVGERVMLVADETDTEVEAWLSVTDAGQAQPGARLTMFLDTAPLSPLEATVRTVAYEATAKPDGTLAYRVRASLTQTEHRPRLGIKGTARIDGPRVPLVWWLFRRPLTVIRQTLGF
jgi:hypothetical protein